MNKKTAALIVLSLFVVSMMAATVSAQDPTAWNRFKNFFTSSSESGTEKITSVGGVFKTVWGGLGEIAGGVDKIEAQLSEGTENLPNNTKFAIRFLMAIIIFGIVWFVSALIPGLQNSRPMRIFLSIILTIIGSLAIPFSFLALQAQSYAAIFVLALGGLPAVMFYYFAHLLPKDNRAAWFGRGFFAGLGGYFLFNTGQGILGITAHTGDKLSAVILIQWFGFGLVIFGVLSMFFYTLVYCWLFRTIMGPTETRGIVGVGNRLFARMGRRAYSFEHLLDAERDELSEIDGQMGAFTVPTAATAVAALGTGRASCATWHSSLDRLRKSLDGRTKKIGVDMYSRAHSTGDKNLTEEAASVEKQVTDIEKNVVDAVAELHKAVTAMNTALTAGRTLNAGEASTVSSGFGSAHAAVKKAAKLMNTAITLQRKVMSEVANARKKNP